MRHFIKNKTLLRGLTLISFLVVFFSAVNGYALRAGETQFIPTFSLRGEYNDNITTSKDNQLEDFMTEISLGLDVIQENKSYDLNLSGQLTQQVFANESDFNNLSQNLQAQFARDLSSRDRITASNSFRHAEEPESFADEFGRTTGRYSYYLNRLNLAYLRDISQQLSMEVHYNQELYAPKRSDLTDSFLNNIGIQTNYALTTETIFGLSYDYFDRSYDPGDNIKSHSLLTAVRQYLTNKVYLDGKVGVDFINSINNNDLVKPRFQLGITHEIDEKTVANFAFSKKYDTNPYTEDVFESWQVSCFGGRDFSERLRVGINAFFGQGEYDALDIEDDYSGVGLSGEYELGKNSKVFSNYTYSTVASSDDTRDYVQNKVSGGIRIKF